MRLEKIEILHLDIASNIYFITRILIDLFSKIDFAQLSASYNENRLKR
jgi:hypothetical protein